MVKGGAWESLGEPGRAWESLGEPGRAWESLGEPGRAWESLGEPGRAWERRLAQMNFFRARVFFLNTNIPLLRKEYNQ